MSEYPHAHALLGELLGLDETDAQLPLPILLNLHRAQLCHPFEGLLDVMATLPPLAVIPQQLAVKMVKALTEELYERYPALDDGGIFVEYGDLDGNLEVLERRASGLRNTQPEWQALADRHEFIEALLVQHENAYEGYAPLIALLQLSWSLSPEMRENRLRALELELCAEPTAVREMILDMAQLGAARLARPLRLALG